MAQIRVVPKTFCNRMEGDIPMNISFDGKVAIVTGAARGIGLACAELLAASGAKVALVDINSENLAEATKKVQDKGVARGYQLDVTNIPAIAPTVSRIRQELGEVDILVCSAGIVAPRPAEDIPEAEWDAILDTNIKGLFFCNQAVAIQSMIPRKTGAVVNIASMFGLVAAPPPLMTAHYCVSKAGVISLTRQGAIEWAQYNIRVNAVAPTFTLTPLSKEHLEDPEFKPAALNRIPLHRFATVDDIAAAVCFLASDAAKMITGVTLPVDGGWTAQ